MKKAQETNYHVEIGFLIINQRLMDAVQYAMDNGIEVVKRVQASCGDPDGRGDLIIKSSNDSSYQVHNPLAITHAYVFVSDSFDALRDRSGWISSNGFECRFRSI